MKKMRQNKKVINKGFTLVELIAVIVIISVISIMSYASMTKTLKNSQIKEIEVFETNLKTAAQMYIETNLKDFPQLDDVGGSVQITTLNLISKGYLDEDIDNPSDCSLKNSYVLAEKQSNNTIEYTVSCIGDVTPTYALYNNGTAVYFNPVTGVKCDAGSAVSTTGTKTGCMKWYAFNDMTTNENVTLILDHNTTASVEWDSTGSSASGPTNVLTQLQFDVSSWAGVPIRTDSYSVSNGTVTYTINYSTYKARLITSAEIATITRNTGFNDAIATTLNVFYLDSNTQTRTSFTTGASNYSWLFDYTNGCTSYGCNIADFSNYGYWTSTAVAGDSSNAWIVSSVGSLDYGHAEDNYTGVRPVITIPKTFIQ
jgi:prepilin-type N-terminal cleavage/methylation domain-containing protein